MTFLVSLALAFAVLPVPVHPKAPAPLQFNRDIRPILAENCFTCHGPDARARQADLRLDLRDAALVKKAIVPGKPDASGIVARTMKPAADPLVMPPAASRKSLTASQKKTLRRWIAEGATYQRHWAFEPLPAKISVPTVKNFAWPINPIDSFVLNRLERAKIAPSRDAEKATWLRRVSLDLTGLPPAPAEIDAFLADRNPSAFGTVVDRLLRSPHFGEQMAVPWLDVARYADSYGYQSDQLSPTWPYRDWVVDAFNRNLSYDQFITQQLAGDLLPDATRETRLATAFNRLHRMTNEGGSVPEEWRQEGVADRVRTTGTAFLGLTVECARCHDHKYDPITQRDFYALASFVNNIDEYGMYDRADIVPSPTLLLPTPAQEQALAAARRAVDESETSVDAARTRGAAAFAQWERSSPKIETIPDRVGRFDFETLADVRDLTVEGATSVEGRSGNGVAFDGETSVKFPALGRFSRHTPFTIAFWMRDAGQASEPAVIFQACDGTDAGPHGYDLLLENGRLTARLFRHWPGNAIAVRTGSAVIRRDVWTHVAVTYDGSSRASGLRIFVDGRVPADLETVRDHLSKGTGQHTLTFGQRFRDRGFKGGRIDDVEIYARDLTPIEVRNRVDGSDLAAATPDERRAFFFAAVDPASRDAVRNRADARAQVVSAEDAAFEIAVMEEMPTNPPRPTYVLARGQYDAPHTEADRVARTTPAALLPFPPNLRRDRLGLARWMTLPNHPLTARVAVNRIWAQFFGRGLVETVEDFGVQGRTPTHPELLDWLARDFIRTGWNTKTLVKKIVLSRTYRQASALRPDLRARDPQNRLLARGPSQRLSAESIRDVALAASGLLDERLGGPPVSPYQPGDLWREANTMSPAYRQSVGGDLYRRSLYSVIKRTAPMPNMLVFDAGSREVCVARRQATNTPLQALVLLNDPQFVEAARVLGEKMLTPAAGSTDADRSRFAFRRLTGRAPTSAELRLLTALFAEQRRLFSETPEDAARLIAIGEKKADPALNPIELAAATVVAQAVLNLDATLWKR